VLNLEKDLKSVHLQISSRLLPTSRRFRELKRGTFHVITSVLHISVSRESVESQSDKASSIGSYLDRLVGSTGYQACTCLVKR